MSAPLINICRDNTDPFYRYKMPSLISKIEGRGNGIRTAVVNTSDVARALNRPPVYVNKFFGFELGAQTSANEKEDRYLVNGAHDAPKLQDLLDVFISKFVLCKSCSNPETDIVITKDGKLYRDCKACGSRSPIEITHKLASFILKNPPASSKSKGGKKGAATASASVGGKRISEPTKNGDSNHEEDGNNTDDELTKRINAEASDLALREDFDEDNWAVDTSEEAVQARVKELQNGVTSMVIGEDDEDVDDNDEDANNPYAQLGEWIINTKPSPSDVEIYKKAQELGIAGKYRTLQVLAQTIFTKEIVNEIESHTPLLQKMINGSPSHEKALLGGTERFIGLDHPDLIPAVPKILFKYYDNDLISEEVVQKWGSKASKKYVSKDVSKKVRKAAVPFLEWLENAESDEEESSDDDDDDEEE